MRVADLLTMMWKEFGEFFGNRRFLRVFGGAVLILGLLPGLIHAAHSRGPAQGAMLLSFLGLFYAVLAAAIVVAQTAPDLVLHERAGHTLDYLLATRLPDAAIFGGKVIVATVVGYVSSLLNTAVQLVVGHLRNGGPWSWSYLGSPEGRILVFGFTAAIALYMAVVGTFVALRVGDQRSAYTVTMLSLAVLAVPVILQWVHIQFTASWLLHALAVLAAIAVALAVVGVGLFRREMIVLYLQE